MSATVLSIIGVSLTAVSLVGVLFGKLMKSNERIVKVEDKVKELTDNYEEFRASNREKWKDYYDFKSSTEKQLSDINATTRTTLEMLKELKQDLKEKK